MDEIWKDVVNYEGLYQVSNLGNVKSVARVVHRKNGTTTTYPERLLKCRSFGNYVQAILSKDGKIKCFTVHRLVATAFIPNPHNYPCVNHKDEVRTNNCVDNLEWCTYKYNNEYNNRVGKCKEKISKTLKEKSYHHKMTNEQKEHIRQGAFKGWETRRTRTKLTKTSEEEL